MAIYAIGEYCDDDVSGDFIANNIAGPGWDRLQAPELYQFVRSLKVGDIVYINPQLLLVLTLLLKELGSSPMMCLLRQALWFLQAET